MAGAPILVVDDDPDTREIVRIHLERGGYRVREATNGADALACMSEQLPILVLLDVMLPDVNGLQLCQRIRAADATRSIPIIMVSARGDEVDRVVGLEVGADDYVTKPFIPKELVARVRAVLRRTGRQTVAHPEPVARSGRILLDPAAYDALVDGEPVQLSAREFELLRFFLQHPRRAFTRAQLIAMVWGAQARMDPRSIDVHIRRLRAALTRRNIPVTAIVTVRGVGYRFNADTVDEETSGGATGSGRIGSRKRQRS